LGLIMNPLEPEPTAIARKTILLVEDDLDIRDVVQEVLEEQGHDVVPARTGRQALEFLALDSQSPPDIVILDLMMPIMTGWQVLETIRRSPQLADIPVVVVTAATQDRPLGAQAFLRKPFDIRDLLETIRKLPPRARST
jgi:two-component system, OmpR family, response regulator CpxR